MDQSVHFCRSVPVRHRPDVFVAGGGPAGVAAALAAASTGASVFLAEAENCFGGMGTAGGLPMFCVFSDGVNFLADGVGRRVYDRLFAAGADIPRARNEAAYRHVVLYKAETLKRIYDELMIEAGVDFSFGTHLVGVSSRDGRIDHAICYGKSGLFAVQADAYVDATGDGDLAVMAGAAYEKGDERGNMQPGTLVSYWSGIDWERASDAGCGLWRQSGRLREAIADGVFEVPDPGMPGIMPTGPQTGNGNVGHLFGIDATDERSVTDALIRGRRIACDYGTYFRQYLTGYENIELVTTAARVGIRESRRIVGEYVLNQDDYWARAVFDDEIGRYCYGIDMHATSLDQATRDDREGTHSFDDNWLPPGESYGIPYRILVPQGFDNLWVAGRCVSVDRPMLGSIRVMPGCFITGQAAGMAAALAADRGWGARGLPVSELQQKLMELGAYLPHVACAHS